MTTITRRAALGGIASVPMFAVPVDASTSPLAELIADFRFAEVELLEASRREDEISAACPHVEQPAGVAFPFRGDAKSYSRTLPRVFFELGLTAEFRDLYERMRDAYGEAARDAMAAIQTLEAASMAELKEQNTAYCEAFRKAGVTDAEAATAAACKVFNAAFDAILDYRPRNLAEGEMRSAFFAGFVRAYPKDWRVANTEQLLRMLGHAA